MTTTMCATGNGNGLKLFADLLRVFVDKKIWHVQVNCISSDTLRAAQREPEKYRDIVVRVVGYSAFFVDLTKPVQNILIARTEHRLADA